MSDKIESDGDSFIRDYAANAKRLIDAKAYDPAEEHDACGVGFIAAIDGKPRRSVVEAGIAALKSLWHRGAVDADGKTGDGAGIHVGIPQDFFKAHIERQGLNPGTKKLAVAQVFLPRNDLDAQERCRCITEAEILRMGYSVFGWRQVPVNTAVCGEKANATRPEIEQMMESELRKARLFPTLEEPVVKLEPFVERHLKASLDQYADLDSSVLGVTEFFEGKPPRISLNRQLTGSALDEDETPPGVLGRWRATLAHEAGHVLLHRSLHSYLPWSLLRFVQSAARASLDTWLHQSPLDDGDGLHGVCAAMGSDVVLGCDSHHRFFHRHPAGWRLGPATAAWRLCG